MVELRTTSSLNLLWAMHDLPWTWVSYFFNHIFRYCCYIPTIIKSFLCCSACCTGHKMPWHRHKMVLCSVTCIGTQSEDIFTFNEPSKWSLLQTELWVKCQGTNTNRVHTRTPGLEPVYKVSSTLYSGAQGTKGEHCLNQFWSLHSKV